VPEKLKEFLIFYAGGIALPGALLAASYRRPGRKAGLTVPFLGLILLVLTIPHNLRWVLLGPDYSRRLYMTIETIAAVTTIAAIYLGVKRRWMPAIASLILTLSWLWIGIVNSVV
jgi:hypothetical protein